MVKFPRVPPKKHTKQNTQTTKILVVKPKLSIQKKIKIFVANSLTLIFMFAASEWKLFVREVSSQNRSMPPNDPPGICLNC